MVAAAWRNVWRVTAAAASAAETNQRARDNRNRGVNKSSNIMARLYGISM